MIRSAVVAVVALALCGAGTTAMSVPGLVSPRLTLSGPAKAQPTVALTLDACTGKTDMRILNALVSNGIPATLFVTQRWMKRNAQALALLKSRPDLFQIENHGAAHVPAIDVPGRAYGAATAGSGAAVIREIDGGARAIETATGRKPVWFRGASALYTQTSLQLIRKTGARVGGYSMAGDGGATLGQAATAKRISTARDGDVILVHVNHPERPAGAGVVEGVLALKRKGYRFVKLGASASR
jgi:peptidoglycan/xylan/chitin deacetylase (PgdA/CDA1 family)